MVVLGAIVLLVNLPVLHLLVRSEPKASGHVPFSDDFTDPGRWGGITARMAGTRG